LTPAVNQTQNTLHAVLRYIPLTDKLCCSKANNVFTENIINLIFADGTEWCVCSQKLQRGT
jgi:hypothetical protein